MHYATQRLFRHGNFIVSSSLSKLTNDREVVVVSPNVKTILGKLYPARFNLF